jgi:hypothetical protein
MGEKISSLATFMKNGDSTALTLEFDAAEARA